MLAAMDDPSGDLSTEPRRAAELVRLAHQRLLGTASGLDDAQIRRASLLPEWSIGHVLTHLARNADGHSRRLAAALLGADEPRYPGGAQQRRDEIDEGEGRPAAQILRDLQESCGRLDGVLAAMDAAGWPHPELLGRDSYGTSEEPAHRLREVEMHHVDLGLEYTSADWPQEYVAWDLPQLLATVPQRWGSLSSQHRLLAWLAGRADPQDAPQLDPWG